ncbi:MAG: hypothetical protein QXZ17_07565 [Nitrososphaerota archaeon]
MKEINRLITVTNRNIDINEKILLHVMEVLTSTFYLTSGTRVSGTISISTIRRTLLRRIAYSLNLILKDVKITNSSTTRQIIEYTNFDRNQIAKCMLLTEEENNTRQKENLLLDVRFKDKGNGHLDRHLKPHEREL